MKYLTSCLLVIVMTQILPLGCSQLQKLPLPKGVRPHEERVKLVYTKDLDPPYIPGKLPIGLSTPVLSEGKIIAGTASGELVEIDRTSHLQKVLLKEESPIFAPVLIQDDMYYVGTLGGDLIGWSKAEGKEKFRVNVGAPIEAPMKYGDGRLVVAVRNHAVVCLDAVTGKMLWNYKRAVASVKTLQRRAGALLVGKFAIMGFADGHLIALRMEDGSTQWEVKVTEGESRHFQDLVVEPIYFEGKILAHAYLGYLKAFKLDTGALEKTILEKPTTNLLLHKGAVFFADTLGHIVKLANNFETNIYYSGLSKSTLFQLYATQESFVVNDHKGSVYWISATTPQILEKTFFLGHAYSTVFGSIAGDRAYLTLISSRNRLYLFKNTVEQ